MSRYLHSTVCRYLDKKTVQYLDIYLSRYSTRSRSLRRLLLTSKAFLFLAFSPAWCMGGGDTAVVTTVHCGPLPTWWFLWNLSKLAAMMGMGRESTSTPATAHMLPNSLPRPDLPHK